MDPGTRFEDRIGESPEGRRLGTDAGDHGGRQEPGPRSAMVPPSRRFPVVVVSLIGVYLALGALYLTGELYLETLERFGHDRLKVWDGEYWRLLTSTFLHGGPLHLAVNILGLYLFGTLAERWLGPRKFLFWYVLFALCGALFFQAFSAMGPGVGASGGICGLIGFFLVVRLGHHEDGGVSLGRKFWLGIGAALVLLHVDTIFADWVMPGVRVAVSAHIGGFVCGVCKGYLHFAPKGKAGAARRVRGRALVAGLLLAVGWYSLAFPVFNWTWYIWLAEKAVKTGDDAKLPSLYEQAREYGGDEAGYEIVRLKSEHGNINDAISYWKSYPLHDAGKHREAGYLFLFCTLYADHTAGDARVFLVQELIPLATRALSQERSPMLLNEVAWYHGLAEYDLQTAEELASEAVSRDPNSMYRNTLGWVQFVAGKYDQGIKNLRLALQQNPRIAANHLFLALAYLQRDQLDDARRGAIQARRGAIQLNKHELKLLEQLEESVSSAGQAPVKRFPQGEQRDPKEDDDEKGGKSPHGSGR